LFSQAQKLLFKDPDVILHAEPTAAKALHWCLKARANRPNLTAAAAAAAAADTAAAAAAAPETAPADVKSMFKVAKALAMLPIIILCYTVLFYKTVRGESIACKCTATSVPKFYPCTTIYLSSGLGSS
jgi:hypothetical protein